MRIDVTLHAIAASDGLRLQACDYGAPPTARLPVVCLPGLTRSAVDFDVLARRLAAAGRRVLALDYRGRGGSAYDPDWRNYNLDVEGRDVETVLAALGITRALFIGTSRGGLHAMRLAAVAPQLVAAAVLNDIGPVLENAGLRRIRGYVGVGTPPTTLATSVDAVKAAAGGRFPALSPADWEAYAIMTCRAPDGTFARRYDAALARTFDGLDLDAPQPTLWAMFDALGDRPLLVVRGATSDLLSPETLAAMATRHPGCRTHVVAGQGHAPLLIDAPTLDVIAAFAAPLA